MPSGLASALVAFQALMNVVLCSYLHMFALVFFDDIIIYSSTQAEHLQHIGFVLNALRTHRLHLKQSKCSFGATTWVAYLGHITSAKGIAMDLSTRFSWSPPGRRQIQPTTSGASQASWANTESLSENSDSCGAPHTSLLAGHVQLGRYRHVGLLGAQNRIGPLASSCSTRCPTSTSCSSLIAMRQAWGLVLSFTWAQDLSCILADRLFHVILNLSPMSAS